MKIKKIVDHGTFASVGLHFVCCGLPVLLVLFGTGIATWFKIPHDIMTGILIVSGVLLITSIVMEFTHACCHSKWKIAALVVCVILYGVGVAGHFGLFNSNKPDKMMGDMQMEMGSGMSCH